MNSTQIGETFRRGVRGNNFMTLEFISYGEAGAFVYEITQGRGIDGERMYGLTVVETDGCKPRHDLSGAAHSWDELQAKIEGLTIAKAGANQ